MPVLLLLTNITNQGLRWRIEMDFKEKAAEIFTSIETELSMDEALQLIEIPPDTQMGDYAVPCFKFAKKYRKSPAVIAAEIAEKTRHLLEASQQQAEELRSAEEEVRLNMEEMATINEHLYRKEVEVQKILEEMKANEEDLQQLEFKFRQTTIQLQQTKKELKNKDNKITELVANEKSFQDELEKIKSRNCN